METTNPNVEFTSKVAESICLLIYSAKIGTLNTIQIKSPVQTNRAYVKYISKFFKF